MARKREEEEEKKEGNPDNGDRVRHVPEASACVIIQKRTDSLGPITLTWAHANTCANALTHVRNTFVHGY